jgi:hypothetical protein
MSAAATAAGYLYASGRLRGRGAREQEHETQPRAEEKQPREEKQARENVRVAVLPGPEDRMNAENPAQKPRRTPKIEYRTRRRWSAA